MPDVDLIVPWGDTGCGFRRAAWRHLERRYRDAGYAPRLAPAPPGEWVKANAVNPAVRESTADIVVVADADVWAEGLAAAIDGVANGAPWVLPHRGVFRLTAPASASYMADPSLPLDALPTTRRPYLGMIGGGIIVARREVIADVPIDPRFVGWGQEDDALGAALNTLHGRPIRLRKPLIHLWHPPAHRIDERVGNLNGWMLWRRYFRATGNPAAMREILSEIDDGS